MSLSRFFIDRPIFAGVISVIIFLAGLIAVTQLPISEYPEVVPPSVVVTARFPGANPQTIAETVATPLEEQINGTEGMLYMGSSAASDGTLTLTVTFKLGVDPNLAQQLVQNRVNQALPRLPDVTRALGVTTTKSSPDLTMVVHLRSPSGRYDMLYLRNYAVLNVKDQLAKIEGVGAVQLFGSGDYAMRLWLNPRKISELGLTAGDVVNAVRRQNAQVAAGVINGPPYSSKGELQLPITVQGRLSDPEQFKEIVIKNAGGVVTRLGDVARVEIDASEYGLRSLLNNQHAVAIPVFQAPGSNAIQISDHVRATMEELKKNFPEGLDYSIVYDPKFQQNHRIFFTFCDFVREPKMNDTNTYVASARLDGDKLSNVKVIFRATPQWPAPALGGKTGGRIVFGKDGSLFVTIGDRDSSPQLTPDWMAAQKLGNHLGKVIHITPDGAPAKDNPFIGQAGALPEIWAYGLRSPEGMAIDPATGLMWESELGPRGGDEINIIKKGANYGWPVITHGIDYPGVPIGEGIAAKEGMEQPVYYWDPSSNPAGMAFYRGNLFPQWRNSLFVAMMNGKFVSRLTIANNKVVAEEPLLAEMNTRFRDVKVGPDGAVYILTDSGTANISPNTPATTKLLKLTPK